MAAHLDILMRPRLGYAANLTRAALKKTAPELLSTFDRLAKGGKAVAFDALSKGYAEEVKERLAKLQDRALTPAEIEALPPLLKDAYQQAVRSAIYGDRYERALRDPFPDGVVDLDFVFKRHLSFIDMEAAERVIKSGKTDLGGELQKMLGAGPKRARQVDGLAVSVEKAPKGKDGRPIQGLDAEDGPFLVVRGEGQVVFAHYSRLMERLEIKACEERGGYAWSALSYEPRSVFERFGDRIPGGDRFQQSPEQTVVSRFQNGAADLESLVWVARAVRGGAPKAKEELAAARAAKTEVLGKLAVAGKWIDNYREMAQLVKAHGEQSLGDADHTLLIARQMERTSYDDNDQERTEVLLKGHGPLFIVKEHAGEVSHAVSLDALERGELRLWIVRDGHAPLLFELNADGRLKEPNANYLAAGIYAVAFDVGFLPGQLREELGLSGPG